MRVARTVASVPMAIVVALACAPGRDDTDEDDGGDETDDCSWRSEAVGPVAEASRFALALDGDVAHVLLADAATRQPSLASRGDGSWSTAPIEPAAGTELAGQPELVARGGVLHAAWTARDAGGDVTTDRTVYAVREEGVWRLEVIDDEGSGHVALSFDADDAPHVAYVANGEVREAVRNAAGSWLPSDNSGLEPGEGAIALHIEGGVSVLTHADPAGDVHAYTRGTDGTWAPRSTHTGTWVAISRDAATQGVVVGRIDTEDGVAFNQVSDGVTMSTTVGVPAGDGAETSLGVGVLSDDTIVIAFRSDEHLKVTLRAPWQRDFRPQTASEEAAGAGLALVIDDADGLHLAHLSATGLQYTRRCAVTLR